MKALLFFLVLAIPFRSDLYKHHDTEYQCTVNFEILNAGFKTTGTIGATIVSNTFNSVELDESKVIIVADPSTIQTGIAIRDKHLQRSDYFDTATYPKIKLESQAFKKIARDKYSGKFLLTIKGKTQTLELPFMLRQKKGKKSFEGTFAISRTEYGIGEASMTLADEVLIKFIVFQM